MNDVSPASPLTPPLMTDRCADQTYRLAVYEAGHALTARALGLKFISIQMLPRPPILISEKAFAANKWEAFIETLEVRIIELFGGQIAEEHACGTNSCCSGGYCQDRRIVASGVGACRGRSGLAGGEGVILNPPAHLISGE